LEFNQLTSEELKLWKQFKQEDIFEWLSGSPIHPPDYSEYIRIRSTIVEPQPIQQQQQHQQVPQPAPNLQPGPAPVNPVPGPSPRKPGRPLGSKNKPKDPLTLLIKTVHKGSIKNLFAGNREAQRERPILK